MKQTNRAIILLNGEPYRGEIEKTNAYVTCCDGAYLWAKDKIAIDENLGDFDSLDITPVPPPKEVYPSEKNYTDGEIALKRAIERGASEILIYGGGGGRDDHFLGNLHLLYMASEKGVHAEMITNYSKISVESGVVTYHGLQARTVSILPFGGDAHIIQSEGFAYPLKNLTLRYGSTRGISNVVVSDTARLQIKSGKVLVIINKEGEL